MKTCDAYEEIYTTQIGSQMGSAAAIQEAEAELLEAEQERLEAERMSNGQEVMA